MVAKILEVFPLVERPYTDRDGRQSTFKSKGVIFQATRGSFYAEAVQEWASHWEGLKIKKGGVVDVSPAFRCRDYKDANGITHYANELTFTNMIYL